MLIDDHEPNCYVYEYLFLLCLIIISLWCLFRNGEGFDRMSRVESVAFLGDWSPLDCD